MIKLINRFTIYTNEVENLNKVCVVGSINMDLVLKSRALPKMGETILIDELFKIPGGKGANQAVAASRLGCEVNFLGAVGKDENGEILLNSMKKDKINIDNISINENCETGIAIINVDENGNNTICVVSGANMKMKSENIEAMSEVIKLSDVIITQLETPMEVGAQAFKIAKNFNKITILNPAPAAKIGQDLLSYTDIIVPNETEAFELTGIEVNDIESAKMAAEKFFSKGVKFVVITLGSKGAAIISNKESKIVPAFKVKAIDTTAAGDSFIGAMAKKISENGELNFESIVEAVTLGNKVSSITVTREGAQSSIPYLEEVKELYCEI